MASAPAPQWRISGQYFETCNCNFLCPCATELTATPTKGDCVFAIALHIERGAFEGTDLSGRDVVFVGRSQGPMANGNWTVGLVFDDGASSEQQQALGTIFSGQVGGPPAALAPVIGQFAGIETRPIQFQGSGMDWSLKAAELVDEAASGVPGVNGSDPMYLDNIGHPVNSRLALAKATRSHVHVFGIDWDDLSGKNNGHFAPFTWQG